jgi:predicted ATP-grasp superfamily ATP-dependent carboligase
MRGSSDVWSAPGNGGGSKPYAIVIGLDSLQGLQTARVLAARDVPVIGIAKNSDAYACRTRVCEEILVTDTGGDRLIDLLSDLGEGFSSMPVLYPCQDKNVILISQHRERLTPWYHIMLPPHEVVETLMSKVTFAEYAQEAGLPIPPTFVLRNREEAETAATALNYPAIVKPAARLRMWSKHTKLKAFVAANPGELLAHYDRIHTWADGLIAQELIQGDDVNHVTANCYFDRRGEPVAMFTSRKLRQWLPTTGQACLSEEIRDENVVKETERLFRGVDYRGLGYLEMKRDERTGTYLIIEPNIGRPTGRSAAAEASGVELLYTMYCDALGWPLPPDREQKFTGVKWIHLVRDLQASIHHWRRGELTPGAWLKSVRGPKSYAIISFRDPLPFLAAMMKAIRSPFTSTVRSGDS